MADSSRRQFLGAAAALAALPHAASGESPDLESATDQEARSRPAGDPRPIPLVIAPAKRPYDFVPTEVDIYPAPVPDEDFIWMDIHGEWGEVSLKLDPEAAAWIRDCIGKTMGASDDV